MHTTDFAIRKRLWAEFRTARAEAAHCRTEGLCSCAITVAEAEAAFLSYVRPNALTS